MLFAVPLRALVDILEVLITRDASNSRLGVFLI